MAKRIDEERRLAAALRWAFRAGYIPYAPHPRQFKFLLDPSREALYGGAAGGGKSDALLMGAAMGLHEEGYAAILFRKTHTDLAEPGALMDRSHLWWSNAKCRWDGSNKIWHFPGGAKVSFGHLKDPNSHLKYQGAEYQFVGFDELTQFPEVHYRYVGLSRMRRRTGMVMPLRLRGATNPGGPGHVWVKERFNLGKEPDPTIVPAGPFYPALVKHNPSINQAEYIESLEGLHPTTREQLLRGDWDVRDPGDYFRREWFGPLIEGDIPEHDWRVRCRAWDLAASEKQTDEKGMRSRTAGVRMSKDRWGGYLVEHATAFWKTADSRNAIIYQTAQADGYGCTVLVEQEPGSGGKDQAETLQRELRRMGYRCEIVLATANKEARADPVASELERGWREGWQPDENHRVRGVRMMAGPWVNDYLDEVEGFPEDELLDQGDATAMAFNWLYQKAVDGAEPVGEREKMQPEVPATANPDDYADDEDGGEEAGWRGMDGLAADRRWHRATKRGRF